MARTDRAQNDSEASGAAPPDRWWGSFDLEPGEAGRWRIGPLELWARRRAQEWRLATRHHAEEDREDWELSLPLDGDQLPDAGEVSRFAMANTTSRLELRPALGDRTIVTRPLVPLHLLGGEEVTLFVSTPLWIRISTDPGDRGFADICTVRLQDTWLGTSTLDGELCYGSKTAARLHEENLPRRAHRAITEVVLKNPSSSELLIERLGLPVSHLPLYWSAERGFCTPRIIIEQGDPAELAQVKLGDRAPIEPAERISEARTRSSRNLIVRALGGLLG